MDVTPLIKQGAQVVQSYAGGMFRVSGEVYKSAVIVFEDRTVSWDVADFSGLSLQDFDALGDAADIDVVLLGCGERMMFLKPEIKKALRERGLFVECMDTGAACRTYNVLMAEGRRVAAALLPI